MKTFRLFGVLGLLISQTFFSQLTWNPNNVTSPKGAWYVGWYGSTAGTCNNVNSNSSVGSTNITASVISFPSTCSGAVSVFQFTTNNATDLATAKTAGNFLSATITVNAASPLIRVSDSRVTQTQANNTFSGAYTYGMTITDVAANTETDVISSQAIPAGAASNPAVTYTTLGTPYIMYPGKTYLVKWYLWTGTSGQTRGIDNPELYFQTASCAVNTTVPNLNNNLPNFVGGTTNIYTIRLTFIYLPMHPSP